MSLKYPAVARRTIRNITNTLRRRPAILLANLLVTRHCTQRCLQCTIPDGAADDPAMSFGTFATIIDRLDRHGTQFISFSGGEPLLNPELADMIRNAAKRGFLHLQLLTNFYAADTVRERIIEVLLDTGTGIQISFDGFGEAADRLRGAPDVAERVMAGIEQLDRANRKHKRPVRTSLNIVLSALNIDQLPELLDYIESIGWKANVDLYRWSSSNHREVDDLKLDNPDRLAHALELIRRSPAVTTPRVIVDGYLDFMRDTYPKRCPYLDCPSLGTKVFIGPTGDIGVCIGEAAGNILHQSLDELFASATWRERLAEMERCRGCWNTCYTPSAIIFHPRSPGDFKAIARTLIKR